MNRIDIVQPSIANQAKLSSMFDTFKIGVSPFASMTFTQ
jgi:hypothetical protein